MQIVDNNRADADADIANNLARAMETSLHGVLFLNDIMEN
jgi:hypothetical protein